MLKDSTTPLPYDTYGGSRERILELTPVSTLPQVTPENSSRGSVCSPHIVPIFAQITIFLLFRKTSASTFASDDLFAKTISTPIAFALYHSSLLRSSANFVFVKDNTRRSVDCNASSVLLSTFTMTISPEDWS